MPLRDQDGSPTNSVGVVIPDGVTIVRIEVRHAQISFYDAEGREALLVQRHEYPGAGLALQLADHVKVAEQ
ncbi:MAG TPA: hypothetical protein VGH56_08570 [Solirubrobacteraceae bacterium]|jgi:hypothetical protein